LRPIISWYPIRMYPRCISLIDYSCIPLLEYNKYSIGILVYHMPIWSRITATIQNRSSSYWKSYEAYICNKRALLHAGIVRISELFEILVDWAVAMRQTRSDRIIFLENYITTFIYWSKIAGEKRLIFIPKSINLYCIKTPIS